MIPQMILIIFNRWLLNNFLKEETNKAKLKNHVVDAMATPVIK